MGISTLPLIELYMTVSNHTDLTPKLLRQKTIMLMQKQIR